MRKVQRDEVVDYATWSDRKPQELPRILQIKAKRRIHVGEYLTCLFENADTIRYQVQEMMRVERIVRDKDIQHEIDTYNEILGNDGELGFVLLIEIADEAKRDELLRQWVGLQEQLYAKLADGTKVYCTFDPRQVGRDRLSSVQYLKLDVGGQVPVALGCDHPGQTVEVALNEEQRSALASDLSSSQPAG